MKNKNKSYINNYNILMFLIMSGAFIFGFLDLFIDRNFERLHIFLFNLTAGGFIILYHTECREKPSVKTWLFLLLSMAYALFAFTEFYPPAIVISLILALIVETYRQKYFTILPKEFFLEKEKTSRKFHHAALLCLELALVFSSLVILNEVYLKVVELEKLKLDMFFLGFSFPVSLITFSLIFRIIEKRESEKSAVLNHLLFWGITSGVGIFFFFIIFKVFYGEIVSALFLFASVLIILTLFFRKGMNVQQKYFLVSGMLFLLISSVSGILYIAVTKMAALENFAIPVIRIHAFFSLYGWNLTGMLVIMRWRDFPIKTNTSAAIYTHWIIIILAPITKYHREAALLTVPLYIAYISYFFFSGIRSRSAVKL